MNSPTFSLPPCPVCSTLKSIERPIWRVARNTTSARGRACYFFVGCKHAAEVADPAKIRDDPAEWSQIEGAWAERARALFDLRVKGWDPAAVEGFRRAVFDQNFLAGPAGSPLPESPAQQQTRTNETK